MRMRIRVLVRPATLVLQHRARGLTRDNVEELSANCEVLYSVQKDGRNGAKDLDDLLNLSYFGLE